jgi:hypothetical protein
MESEFGNGEQQLRSKPSASLSTGSGRDDLVRNGLNNLVLGPILSEAELGITDHSQYLMI